MIRTRYYIGLTTRHGEPVSHEMQEQAIECCASAYSGGCTAYYVEGCWRGQRERTLILEAMTDDRLPDIARQLGMLADQDTVLWTAEPVTAGFVKVRA